jgi:hypothetical protein
MVTTATHLRSIVNEDGAAILDTEMGTLTTLNATGAYVWQALERSATEETIIAGLAQVTGESAQLVASDVRDFIATLSTHKLIRH